jgi:hypothetical protein
VVAVTHVFAFADMLGSVPATATIRVTPETRDRLNRIGAARGMSAGDLVAELAAQAEDRQLLEAMERHYDRLKSDSEAREHYRVEVAAWDTTAGDGLAVSG